MIGQILSLMGAMYDAIGPGLLLIPALPFLALALILIVRTGIKTERAPE